MINHANFWTSISRVIEEGFTADGLQQLDKYAELFISERLVYKRFSPLEQYGCAAGGTTHVIATLLAGAEVDADTFAPGISDFKRMCQRGETQALRIEQWAKAVGVWSHCLHSADDVVCFGEEVLAQLAVVLLHAAGLGMAGTGQELALQVEDVGQNLVCPGAVGLL